MRAAQGLWEAQRRDRELYVGHQGWHLAQKDEEVIKSPPPFRLTIVASHTYSSAWFYLLISIPLPAPINLEEAPSFFIAWPPPSASIPFPPPQWPLTVRFCLHTLCPPVSQVDLLQVFPVEREAPARAPALGDKLTEKCSGWPCEWSLSIINSRRSMEV